MRNVTVYNFLHARQVLVQGFVALLYLPRYFVALNDDSTAWEQIMAIGCTVYIDRTPSFAHQASTVQYSTVPQVD